MFAGKLVVKASVVSRAVIVLLGPNSAFLFRTR